MVVLVSPFSFMIASAVVAKRAAIELRLSPDCTTYVTCEAVGMEQAVAVVAVVGISAWASPWLAEATPVAVSVARKVGGGPMTARPRQRTHMHASIRAVPVPAVVNNFLLTGRLRNIEAWPPLLVGLRLAWKTQPKAYAVDHSIDSWSTGG